jgi:hypothetical protein
MLIRETEDPSYEPKIVASYDYGKFIDKNVSNMSEAQVSGISPRTSFLFCQYLIMIRATEVIRSLQIEGSKLPKADYPTLPDII